MIINPYVYAASFPPPDPSGPSPSDLANLELWLKANNSQFASTADGDQISVDWQDSSTNNRDASPVASGPGTIFPILKYSQLNGYPAIRMVQSGTTNGGWFTLPDFLTGFTAGEVFSVIILDNDPVSHNASHAAANWGPATDDSYYPFSGDNKIYDKWGTTARKDAISYTGALTSWHMYNVRTASGAWSNYKNGTQLFSTGTNTVGWGTSPMIARNTQNSKTLQGLVAEVIFYSSVLSSSDRFNTIHTYFNNKYNLGLPTS